MLEFFQVVSVVISCVAIVMIVFLLTRESRLTRKFELFKEEDVHTISRLNQEKESLRSEILDKLTVLTKEEHDRQSVMSSILKKLEDEDKVGGDIINLFEFKAKKLETQIDDRVSERLNRFQQDVLSIKERLRAIEEKLGAAQREVAPPA